MSEMNRRQFTQRALSGAMAAGVAMHMSGKAALAAGAANQPTANDAPGSRAGKGRVRLGAPIFEKSKDPEDLALAHVRLGYRGAYCPAVSLDDSQRVADIREAFEKHGVVIAEVGRWCNLLDADPEKRKANLKTVTEGLALAEEIGALCCVDIAGSYNTEVWYGPHPDNLSRRFFDAAVANARTIIDAVKPKRARFCYEMMGWALPDSPDSYVEMLRAVDRKAFAAHLDPCNLVNSPSRFYRNTDLLNECFDKLGPHIVSCHAKDLEWVVEMNVHFREVPPGSGKLDYPTYLRRLAGLDHQPPLMVEHCADEAEYDQARRFIQQLAPTVGVEL
jgi:sugar phosphate isomerase/epimerase